MKRKSQPRSVMQNKSLPSIIREIVRIADPGKIFLLSASYNYQLTENIFKNLAQEYGG